MYLMSTFPSSCCFTLTTFNCVSFSAYSLFDIDASYTLFLILDISSSVVPEYTNLPSFIIKFDVDIYSISETI